MARIGPSWTHGSSSTLQEKINSCPRPHVPFIFYFQVSTAGGWVWRWDGYIYLLRRGEFLRSTDLKTSATWRFGGASNIAVAWTRSSSTKKGTSILHKFRRLLLDRRIDSYQNEDTILIAMEYFVLVSMHPSFPLLAKIVLHTRTDACESWVSKYKVWR